MSVSLGSFLFRSTASYHAPPPIARAAEHFEKELAIVHMFWYYRDRSHKGGADHAICDYAPLSGGPADPGLRRNGPHRSVAGGAEVLRRWPSRYCTGKRLVSFREAEAWLKAYFAKAPLPALPPLAPQGSSFRQAVWQLLLEIPYGTVTTYGALAQKLRDRGISAAAQAVGGAVGHNPISILIPCHRVVGSDGSLTGYAGGVAKKQLLLELEGVDMAGLYVPTRGTAL